MSGVTRSGSTFFQKSGSFTSISACSNDDSPVNMLFLRMHIRCGVWGVGCGVWEGVYLLRASEMRDTDRIKEKS